MAGHPYRIEGDEQPPSAFDSRCDHKFEIVRHALRLVEMDREPANHEELDLRLEEGLQQALVRVEREQLLRHGWAQRLFRPVLHHCIGVCRRWRAGFAQPLVASVAVDLSQSPGSSIGGASVWTPTQWSALLPQVNSPAREVLDQVHKGRLFHEVTAHARAGPELRFDFVEKIIRDVGVTARSTDPRRDDLPVQAGGRHPIAHLAGVSVALLLRDSSEEDLFIRLAVRQYAVAFLASFAHRRFSFDNAALYVLLGALQVF
ncbi:MAG: hypothetical protein AUH82_01135 [Chloroflexi bacterium 13_1_40CM_4_65_13]|nr:MAG: hypothetical protein AUH82_01135 [Chloroflexi bacterium 13_1_40CM_4_65_13]